MTKLKNFAKKKKFRLVDLFRQFDKDSSWSVSHEEFRLGIKSSGIEMSEADICTLIDRLDSDGDGEVDYGYIYYILTSYIKKLIFTYIPIYVHITICI